MPHVAGSVKCRHEAWEGATKLRGTWVFLYVIPYDSYGTLGIFDCRGEEQLSRRGATKVRELGLF